MTTRGSSTHSKSIPDASSREKWRPITWESAAATPTSVDSKAVVSVVVDSKEDDGGDASKDEVKDEKAKEKVKTRISLKLKKIKIFTYKRLKPNQAWKW